MDHVVSFAYLVTDYHRSYILEHSVTSKRFQYSSRLHHVGLHPNVNRKYSQTWLKGTHWFTKWWLTTHDMFEQIRLPGRTCANDPCIMNYLLLLLVILTLLMGVALDMLHCNYFIPSMLCFWWHTSDGIYNNPYLLPCKHFKSHVFYMGVSYSS